MDNKLKLFNKKSILLIINRGKIYNIKRLVQKLVGIQDVLCIN